MTENVWTRRPSREALSRAGGSGARRALAWSGRPAALAVLLWTTFASGGLPAWGIAVAVLGLLVCPVAAWASFRTTPHHRLLPSVAVRVALMRLALAAWFADLRIPAVVLWCGCAVAAVERLPLVVAVPAAAAGLGAYAAVTNDTWTTTVGRHGHLTVTSVEPADEARHAETEVRSLTGAGAV